MTRPTCARLALLALAALVAGCIAVDENGNPLAERTGSFESPAMRIEQASRAASQAFSDGAAAEIDADWTHARDAYGAIAEDAPDDLRAVLAVARTHHAEGDARGALEVLEVELSRRPVNQELLLATADTLLAAGDTTLALEFYGRAAEVGPLQPPAVYSRIAALILSEQYLSAMAELETIEVRALPRHLLVPAARVALLTERPRYAVSALRLHLSTNSDDPVAWREKARAHLLLHEYAHAEQCLTRSLVLEPTSAEGFVLLGHLRYLNGDLTKALRCYQTAVKNGADREQLAPIMVRLISSGASSGASS